MNRSKIYALALLAVLLSSSLFASGGSSSPAPVPAAPSLSPEQIAVNEYNAGLELREKALAADDKAAAVDGKKRAKFEAKRDGLFEKAAKRFQVAINKKPNFAQAHGSLGYALRRLGKFDEAMVAYDTALGLNPNYPNAIEYRGEALLGLGRVAEAQEAYQKLATMSSEHALELLAAIELWAAANQSTEAAEVGQWANDRTSLASDRQAESGPQSWR